MISSRHLNCSRCVLRFDTKPMTYSASRVDLRLTRHEDAEERSNGEYAGNMGIVKACVLNYTGECLNFACNAAPVRRVLFVSLVDSTGYAEVVIPGLELEGVYLTAVNMRWKAGVAEKIPHRRQWPKRRPWPQQFLLHYDLRRVIHQLTLSPLCQIDISEIDSSDGIMSISAELTTFMAVILAFKSIIRRQCRPTTQPHGRSRYGCVLNRNIGRNEAGPRLEEAYSSTNCSSTNSLKTMGPPSSKMISNISSECRVSTTSA